MMTDKYNAPADADVEAIRQLEYFGCGIYLNQETGEKTKCYKIVDSLCDALDAANARIAELEGEK